MRRNTFAPVFPLICAIGCRCCLCATSVFPSRCPQGPMHRLPHAPLMCAWPLARRFDSIWGQHCIEHCTRWRKPWNSRSLTICGSSGVLLIAKAAWETPRSWWFFFRGIGQRPGGRIDITCVPSSCPMEKWFRYAHVETPDSASSQALVVSPPSRTPHRSRGTYVRRLHLRRPGPVDPAACVPLRTPAGT